VIDFVRNGGDELSHRCQTIRVRQLHLQRTQCFRSVLALGQVEHECHTLIAFFETRHADQHGHAAAVLPVILLLDRLQTEQVEAHRFPIHPRRLHGYMSDLVRTEPLLQLNQGTGGGTKRPGVIGLGAPYVKLCHDADSSFIARGRPQVDGTSAATLRAMNPTRQ